MNRPGLASNQPGVQGTIRAFPLFGVPVRFHFTFVLLVIFLVVTGLAGKQSPLSSTGFIAGLFVSVLLHEMGHAWVAKKYGIRTIEIVMFPIGGVCPMRTVA